MTVFNKEEGLATDVGEYWDVGAESATPVIVVMSIDENLDSVDFCYHAFEGSDDPVNLVVPVDRLRKLLRKAK